MIEGFEPGLLRAYRRHRGFTQKQLAERLVVLAEKIEGRRLGATGSLVGRWERGEQRPRYFYVRLLRTIFGTSASDLGLVPFRMDPADYCAVPDDLPVEAERPRLLHLINSAVDYPVAGLPPATLADPYRLAHALGASSERDHAVLGVVQHAIALAGGFDSVWGPRSAVAPALVQQHVVRTFLEEKPSVARHVRLLVLAAEVAQLLGCVALDLDAPATSRSCLEEALRLARDAGAGGLAGSTLAHLSRVAVAEGCPDEGLALAEKGAGEGGLSPRARSLLAGAEAGALAELGDQTGTQRAADRARDAFAQSGPGEEPPWMRSFDQAAMEGLVGAAYLSAGLTKLARRASEQAVTLCDPLAARDQAHWLAQLAHVHALDGDGEEACQFAGEALILAADTRSDRAIRRIRTLRPLLSRWESQPLVRAIDARLITVRAWCAPPDPGPSRTRR